MSTQVNENVSVLTEGEWRALLGGCIPDQYASLIRRLGVYHGVIEPQPCPTCGCKTAPITRGDSEASR